MDVVLRSMAIDDYAAVRELWSASEGIGLSDADSFDGIASYLLRNPALSYVACEGSRIVGAILAGHDGRRGYLHHLAVRPTHRSKGIGRRLVQAATQALQQQGVAKVHLFLFEDNAPGEAFWTRLGWQGRDNLRLMSKNL